MRFFLVLSVLLFCSPTGFAQNEAVDELAQFKGGKAAMVKFLQKNLNYPETAVENKISGKVYVRFVVTKKGKIENVSVVNSMSDCPECNAEVLRVIRKMPKWKPGKLDGKKVDSWFMLPVSFQAS